MFTVFIALLKKKQIGRVHGHGSAPFPLLHQLEVRNYVFTSRFGFAEARRTNGRRDGPTNRPMYEI